MQEQEVVSEPVTDRTKFKPGDLDTVKFISKHLEQICLNVSLSSSQRNEVVKGLLDQYHTTPDLTEDDLQEIRRQVVLHMWYLFPYVLSMKKFPAPLFEEALQNMVISTLRAIDKFDVTRNCKFSSYLTGYLQDAISQAVQDSMLVRQPATYRRRLLANLRLAQMQRDNLVDSTEEPSEMSPSMECDGPTWAMKKDAALSTYYNDVNYSKLSEEVGETDPEQELYGRQAMTILEYVFSDECRLLTEREREAAKYRFGIFGVPRLTLEEVTQRFHNRGWKASKEWIHQLQRKALVKIRRYMVQCGVTGTVV